MSTIKWLDCTLRDGGYQNLWDFPLNIVEDCIRAAHEAGAHRIEIGFRSIKERPYRGFSAFTPDSILSCLELPDSAVLGVMVNTSELADESETLLERLGILFPKESQKHLRFVRLATHVEEVEHAGLAADWLRSKGYEVGLNLMQASEMAFTELMRSLEGLPSESVDVLYLADSLGTMEPDEVKSTFQNLSQEWPGELGFHAHDNKGLALANTLAALDSGATWVDSTITGMGRGAGNVRSELLVEHLFQGNRSLKSTNEMERLIQEYFSPLQQALNWGPSGHYTQAAFASVHPTFVQELTTNSSYSQIEIRAVIDKLSESTSQRYSENRVRDVQAWIEKVESPRSSWDQHELFADRHVLIIGSGPSVIEHQFALNLLASRDDIITVGTNVSLRFDSEKLAAHVACHPLKMLSDSKLYEDIYSRLIAPKELLPENLAKSLSAQGKLFDMGLRTGSITPSAEQGRISLPKPNVLGFSLLLALSGGASAVFLAGFDGWSPQDSRRTEEQLLIDQVLALDYPATVTWITPTKFSVPQESLYSILS